MNKTVNCIKKKSLPALAVMGLLALGAGAPAHAKVFPDHPVRIVTPYDPGSTVDTTTRLVAEGLSKKFGQSFIVENRTGGFGVIAMNALLHSPADGYTLLTDTPAAAINPTLYKTAYNAKTDVTPIAQLMELPFMIAVHPSVKANTAADLVKAAQQAPGAINSAVAGTSTGLVGELFSIQTGATFLPVQYKGAGQAMLATLKNETQVIFLDAANLAPYITAGKLKGLLITGHDRWPVLKDVPTAREAGFGAFDVSTWFGLFSRSGVPQDVVDKLNEGVREVMRSPKVQAYLVDRGAVASTFTAPEFKVFFDKEVDMWADVIKKADVKVN